MSDPIVDYLEWKKQGGELRARAKHAIESRFRELLTEAAQLAEAYKEDFGATLAPPPVVTAFKFKAGGKKPPAKKVVAAAPVVKAAVPAPVKTDPKIVALEKQLGAARKKLDAAKEKGGATKNLEDRVYELEDDLRLATQSV
jgi:hypothetical protein